MKLPVSDHPRLGHNLDYHSAAMYGICCRQSAWTQHVIYMSPHYCPPFSYTHHHTYASVTKQVMLSHWEDNEQEVNQSSLKLTPFWHLHLFVITHILSTMVQNRPMHRTELLHLLWPV